jgi:hypothetical protein
LLSFISLLLVQLRAIGLIRSQILTLFRGLPRCGICCLVRLLAGTSRAQLRLLWRRRIGRLSCGRNPG